MKNYKQNYYIIKKSFKAMNNKNRTRINYKSWKTNWNNKKNKIKTKKMNYKILKINVIN